MKNLDKGVHRDAFEEDHDGLHKRNRRRDPGNEIEERLCGRRIDGVGVVTTVDVVEDVLMRCAEEGQNRVAGSVAVRADVRVLDDAVPDVTVDIGGEVGFRKQSDEATGNGDDENDREGEAVDRLRKDEESRGEIEDDDQPETPEKPMVNWLYSLMS